MKQEAYSLHPPSSGFLTNPDEALYHFQDIYEATLRVRDNQFLLKRALRSERETIDSCYKAKSVLRRARDNNQLQVLLSRVARER